MSEKDPASALRGIDPRGPRFGAAITAALLLVVIALGLGGAADPSPELGARVAQPAFVLLAVATALFAWGAAAGIARHPYGWLFRRLIRPRLAPPRELEDPRPPTFAQGMGLVVAAAGLLLQLFAVPYGLVAAAALAFVAAYLNAAFGYCIGCQVYLLLIRLRGRRTAIGS